MTQNLPLALANFTQHGVTQNARLNTRTSPRRLVFGIWPLVFMLVLAVMVGGGGSRYAFANLTVQLGALGLLAMHRVRFFLFWKQAPASLRLLIAASLSVPFITIIPLPLAVQEWLPGREMVLQSFELAGYKGWFPVSVDPIRTALALSALIVPLALICIGWTVSRAQLVTLGWVAVALGLINFAIGVPQVLSQDQSALFYPENPMPGVLFGSFANRNSAGLFLVCMLTLSLMLPSPERFKLHVFVRGLIAFFLAFGVVLTQSRTAIVLIALPCGLLAARTLAHYVIYPRLFGREDAPREPPARLFVGIGAVALLAVAIGSVLAISPGRLGSTFERFDVDSDPRIYIWDDASYSAQRYWPVGSGVGTFDEVFQVDESIENLTQKQAGRAHNDYLELVIETGLAGLAVLSAWLAWLVSQSWRARLSTDQWTAWSGSAILMAIALQSITDYPLRNLSMLSVGAFAVVILTRFARSPRDQSPPDRSARGRS